MSLQNVASSLRDIAKLSEQMAAVVDEASPSSSWVSMVAEFHTTFGHPVAERPLMVTDVPVDRHELRYKLIVSEVKEYLEAIEQEDTVKFADGLLDLAYVVIGTLITNFPPELVERMFAEVHRSNMTKLGEDGKPIYDKDGKIVKGPNFEPPRLREILNEERMATE